MATTELTEILKLRSGQTFASNGMTLQIAHRSWEKMTADAHEAEIIKGTFPADWLIATEDGRGARLDLMETDGCGAEVYAEKYTAEGRAFHGWIDAESRGIVQWG